MITLRGWESAGFGFGGGPGRRKGDALDRVLREVRERESRPGPTRFEPPLLGGWARSPDKGRGHYPDRQDTFVERRIEAAC